MIRYLLALLVLAASFTVCRAQTNPRYLLLYKDKTGSPYSTNSPADFLSERAIARRTRQQIPVTPADFPPNPDYLAAVKATGARIIYSSRWFNGSLIEATDAQLALIKNLSFYKGIELNLPVANLTSQSPGVERIGAVNQKLEAAEDINYGNMNAQLALLDVPALHQKGFQGEGMLIAVLDNGFFNGNTVGFLSALRDENRILDTHDFLARDGDVYNDGSHGLSVLSTIAAYQPGTMVGAAFKANFALYRTENDYIEAPYEEITWLLAAERADSVGADVINSSLGYSTFENEFNTSEYNYTYADMDGKTTIISRAARYAARTGMIVVTSAGNEGNNAWQYITAPADVDSVLSVGATSYNRAYASLSSVGPNAAGQQKPDVAAVGSGTIIGSVTGAVSSGSGTSYSSPQIAGLVAILWQAHPTLTAAQVIYALKKSGHQAAAPDNRLGYGVPSAIKAEEIIAAEFTPLGTEKETLQSIVLSPNPAQHSVTLSIPPSLTGKTGFLEILSVNGASLWSRQDKLDSDETIATGHLPAGLYFIKIKVDYRERLLKFIRQ